MARRCSHVLTNRSTRRALGVFSAAQINRRKYGVKSVVIEIPPNFEHLTDTQRRSCPMSGLKFSFNKPKEVVKPPINTSKPAFGDSDDEENVFTKAADKKLAKKQPNAIAGLNQDLRSYTSLSEETSVRMAKEALEVDPSGT